MPMKKYKPEQVVTLLRQVQVELANRIRGHRQLGQSPFGDC
jgi:hypothetical protein